MSRVISEILQATEPKFSHMLQDWERTCGNQAYDLRLLTEINQSVKQVIRDLSLDQNDTLPEELYYALQQKAMGHNEQFSRYIKVSGDSTPDEVVKKVIGYIDSSKINRDVWVIKSSVIKQWLKKQPPKKLLKCLKLKSIDSVLKRTKPAELLALAYLVESPEWRSKMHACYRKLTASDFQEAKSEVIIVPKAYCEKLRAAGVKIDTHILKPLYEAGVVLVFSPRQRFEGDVMVLTLALLQSVINTRIYCSYFRLISVKKNFGELVLNTIKYGFGHESVKFKEVEWPIIQKHLVRSPREVAIYQQPHFYIETAGNHEPLEILAESLPVFDFWKKYASVVFVNNNAQVSCHLIDVVTNNVNRSAYKRAELSNVRARLWEELCLRYLAHEEIEKQLLDEL